MCSILKSPRCLTRWSSTSSRWSKPDAGPHAIRGQPRQVSERLKRFSGTAQQKHTLLAEHVPEPPGGAEPQRPAIEIERDRTLHLDVDLVAKLDEILDGTKMDVGSVVPCRRQIVGAGH